MNLRAPLNFGSIYDTFKALLALVLTMSTAMAVISGAAWWILEPRFRPYFDKLESVTQIATMLRILDDRISEIENRVPELQVLEFQDVAEVEPELMTPGGRITITYVQRRNFSCSVRIIARYYSVTQQGFDVSLGSEFPGVRAPVTDAFAPFSIVLTLPKEISLGRWSYAPEIIPAQDCISTSPIYPPPAYFTVQATNQ